MDTLAVLTAGYSIEESEQCVDGKDDRAVIYTADF